MPHVYKRGDSVEIVDNTCFHGFQRGDIVTIIKRKEGYAREAWYVEGKNHADGQVRYFVTIKDIKLIKNSTKAPSDDGKCECVHCGGEFDENDCLDEAGDWYCEDCHSEQFICCEHCSDSCAVDEAIEACEQYYCSDRCARQDGMVKCEDCSEWVDTNNDAYYDNHGNYVCSGCYEENYCSCEDCGETCHNDDLEDGYCRDCRENQDDEGEQVIKSYEYKPREFVYDKMPWENTIYLGIELEVECNSRYRTDDAKKVLAWLQTHKVQDRVYIKEDGSLTNGFELVFMPSTLQALHKRFPMAEFLKYLKSLGLTSEDKGTCGLHVHISRNKLKDRDILAGKIMFFKCRDRLVKLSARKDTEEGLNYCKFDQKMPKDHKTQEFGRYSALNTRCDHTIEIRMFRGTLDYDRFQASLQFSDMFAEYIQQVGLLFIKMASGDKVWADFLAFGKRKSRYQQFLGYCKGKGIV